MRIKCIIYIILLSSLLPSVKPENNSTINYIHVLFEWEAISDVSEYRLSVISNNATILDITTSNFFYVDENSIDWENTYSWQICEASNSSVCSDTYTFSTGSEIDLGDLNLTIDKPAEYYDGVTIFGNLTPAFSAAIDRNGRQIWNSGGLNTFCYFKRDQQGRFYGGKYSADGPNILPGIEFDINGAILFEEPANNELGIISNGQTFIQHEIIKINDSQYLFFVPEDQMLPVPLCATTPGCTDSDGEYYWEEDYEDIGGYHWWRGERIILWDTVTNQIEWEWNAFNHIPLNDFDQIINWGSVTTPLYYDWIHFNALDYSLEENALYVSSRHLSRIYKIALNSYDDPNTDIDETIIWSMGYDPTGNGNTNIQLNDENGEYNGFTFQHGLQLLDNGNIVTLDNGNISGLIFDDYDGISKTRALEIDINEENNTATIVFDHTLDDYLFGDLSGNVQKLDNGNYLITTIGGYGHSIEVDPSGASISDLQYKIDSSPTGKMYRADRIKSLYETGCIDTEACNHNPNARKDDNSCEYPVGTCLCGDIDTDSDGVCDNIDICPNNFDPFQNDNDGDDLADACEDPDDDNDGIDDCWNFALGMYVPGDSWGDHVIYYDENDQILTEQDLLPCVQNGGDYQLTVDDIIIPNEVSLLNPYPNPFNPTVNFDIKINQPSKINIDIYSIDGTLVESIYNEYTIPGTHGIKWNGKSYPSGIYLINLIYNNNSITKKVLLLK